MCACEHGYAKVVKRLLAVDGCDARIADHVRYNLSTIPATTYQPVSVIIIKIEVKFLSFVFTGRQHVFFNCNGTQSKRHCFDDI